MPNMLGAYGDWAAGLVPDPPRLSFRRGDQTSLETWRDVARTRYREALLQPDIGLQAPADVQHRFEFAGLDVEHLQWQVPYGPPTEALVLKPAGATGRLPAVLALHDHAGNKYFGTRKITRVSASQHPMMARHQAHYYEGTAWANELARRGYVVLVHDAFAFASRRMRAADIHPRIKGDLVEASPESQEEIDRYNQFASEHEHVIGKSLFCAGTTWPGVFTAEDQRALDYLCARPDVDASRVGCGGLSGGGLRTVYLTGLDVRIRCACCVGMMSTWRDYLLNTSFTHTWMVYIPGLARDLDYPEILGLAAPVPALVLNNSEDQLFTLPEMQRADRILADVYAKADAPDRYRAAFYPGPHKFDLAMQREAFAWFDRWLQG
jgi:dienelactone hydrolase